MNMDSSDYSFSEPSMLDEFLIRMTEKYFDIPEASGPLREHVIRQFLVIMAHEEELKGENGPASQDWYELYRLLVEMKKPQSLPKKISVFDTL